MHPEIDQLRCHLQIGGEIVWRVGEWDNALLHPQDYKGEESREDDIDARSGAGRAGDASYRGHAKSGKLTPISRL